MTEKEYYPASDFDEAFAAQLLWVERAKRAARHQNRLADAVFKALGKERENDEA